MIRTNPAAGGYSFFFPAFSSFFIHEPFVPIRCFFWGEGFMEWRELGGRLQRSLVTAASFMDYGSLVVINALLRTMGPSLLGSGLS
jgi:hypothetical protein